MLFFLLYFSLLPLVVPPLTNEQIEDFTKLCNAKMQAVDEEKPLNTDNHTAVAAKEDISNKTQTVFGIWKLEEGKQRFSLQCALF